MKFPNQKNCRNLLNLYNNILFFLGFAKVEILNIPDNKFIPNG